MNVNSESNGISVVLCCHNSASRLPETLKRLAAQVVPKTVPWEVVVVNNASTDDTADVAVSVWEQAGARAPFRVVDEPESGLSHARERGIACARYGTLLFVDDDNWLEPAYLGKAHELMWRHPEIGALGGDISPHFEAPPPEWFERVKSCYALGAQGRSDGDITDYKPHVAGAGMVLRKSAYEELVRRGFKPVLVGRKGAAASSGEDYEICYALVLCGYRIWYDSGLKLAHFMPKQRLNKPYFWQLARGIRSAGPALAPYELALRGAGAAPLRFYFRRVFLLGWWLAKDTVKFLSGREAWLTVQIAFMDWLQSLSDYGELRRATRDHLTQVMRLRHG